MSGEVDTEVTILFVDDSATDRTLGTGLIRKAHPDWRIVPVRSVDEAIAVLAEQSVDIVVSDLVMPKVDGRQFLKIMSSDYPLIPVVLITSQGDDRIAAECIGLGAVNYVPKRNLSKDLVPILDEVLKSQQAKVATEFVLQHVVQNQCRFEIDSNLEQIRWLVNFIKERLHSIQMMGSAEVQNVTTAVREALLNAHFHGNFEVNSRPLERNRNDYIELAASRREDASFADRHIRLTWSFQAGLVSIKISDDGSGFDASSVPKPSGAVNEDAPKGVGMVRMRSLMTTVSYNDVGNEVTLTYALAQNKEVA